MNVKTLALLPVGLKIKLPEKEKAKKKKNGRASGDNFNQYNCYFFDNMENVFVESLLKI